MQEMLGKREDLHEVDWVKEQTRTALSSLQKEVLYTKNGDEVKFDVDTSLDYLKTLKDKKTYKEVMEKNPGATIMAVQILLKNKGFNVGKIDGILKTQGKATSKTMEAIKEFQRQNGLKDDGALGPDTIKKLLEVYGNGGGNGGGGNSVQQQPESPEKLEQAPELMTLADIKKIDIAKLGKFGPNGFVFNKGMEKSDKKGKYIELQVGGKKKRIYEIGNNKDGIFYERFTGVSSFLRFANFKNGSYDGRETYISSEGYKYVGDCKNGIREGLGTITLSNGEKYVGQFKNGVREGLGTITWSNGNKYVGQFKNGVYEGRGKYTWSNGDKYVGQFKNGVYEGQGKYTWSNGDKYVGQFKNGVSEGQGTITWSNGNKYVGQFKNDRIWTGITYDKDGKTVLKKRENGK